MPDFRTGNSSPDGTRARIVHLRPRASFQLTSRRMCSVALMVFDIPVSHSVRPTLIIVINGGQAGRVSHGHVRYIGRPDRPVGVNSVRADTVTCIILLHRTHIVLHICISFIFSKDSVDSS